ncbi:hypothetical protein HanIR_Chr10g0500711 [Helianthus annuus]|nr:hypothetical protein HanIR_Chr10g0500711 [Helianthus annuus]
MNKAFRCVGKNELVKHLDLLKRKKNNILDQNLGVYIIYIGRRSCENHLLL